MNEVKLTPIKQSYAIIGKMWTNQDNQEIVPANYVLKSDMEFSANESYLIGALSFRTDRNLNASEVTGEIKPVSVKAGSKLFFFSNNKRTDRDPDYSVSVLLPEDEASVIIENSRAGALAWKTAHPVA